jgi:hypothetical protein
MPDHVNIRITPDLDAKLTDFQQMTGLSRSALVRLILTRMNREVFAVLMASRDSHAGAQRLLASLKHDQHHDRR